MSNTSNNPIELGFDIDALINKGKPRRKYTFAFLKEGIQAFRILPSFDPANRRLEHSYTVHWLTGENGKPNKILCTYTAERYCPICVAHKDTKEALEHSKKSNPDSDNTKRLAEAERRLSGSKSIYYNAVNASGEPVVLELNSTVSKALEALIIKAVQEKGFDPTALKGGVWFEFAKTGKGRDSVRVDFKRISKLVEGDMVDVLDRSAFSEELVTRLPQAVANIHDPKVVWIKEYTSAQLSDYLRGVPLPQTNGYATSSAAAPDTSADDDREPQAAPASAGPVITPVSSIPKATSATSVSTGGKLAGLSAEADRLMKLANGGN